VGKFAFRELSVSLARCGEEYGNTATGDGSVAVATNATPKLDADPRRDQKAELMSGLDFNFIPQNLQGVGR